jgi:hypothetical protein
MVEAVPDPVDLAHSGPADRADAYDTVRVVYTVRNTGDIALAEITVSDATTIGMACASEGAAGTIVDLQPDTAATCSATHVITQAELDDGLAAGTVVAADPAAPAAGAAPYTVALDRRPSFTHTPPVVAGPPDLAGCLTASTEAAGSHGATATFCFTVVNTGNVTLAGLVITDAALGLGPSSAAPTALSATLPLAPGGQATFAVPVTIDGLTISTAAATMAAPSGATVTAGPATALLTEIPVEPAPPEPQPGTVSGVAWFDRNSNGVFDTGEWPLPGATVSLLPSPSGQPTAAHTAALVTTGGPGWTTVTDSTGHYAFVGVPPGTYAVVATVALAGFGQTSDSDGDGDWVVGVTVPGGGTAEADFSGDADGHLAGTVVAAATGAPLPGATVTCTWGGIDGVAGTDDDVVMTAVAATDGGFDLPGVPYGDYGCQAQDPATGETSAEVLAEVVDATPATAALPIGTAAPAVPAAFDPAPPAPAPAATGHAPLALTGTNATTTAALGVALTALGAGLVLASRRRRRTTG